MHNTISDDGNKSCHLSWLDSGYSAPFETSLMLVFMPAYKWLFIYVAHCLFFTTVFGA